MLRKASENDLSLIKEIIENPRVAKWVGGEWNQACQDGVDTYVCDEGAVLLIPQDMPGIFAAHVAFLPKAPARQLLTEFLKTLRYDALLAAIPSDNRAAILLARYFGWKKMAETNVLNKRGAVYHMYMGVGKCH